MPTKVVFGDDSLDQLPGLAASLGSRYLLVSGRSSMRETGVLERAVSLLGDTKTVLYEGVAQMPVSETIDGVVEMINQEECDVVIGLGGGAVLDVAKCAAILRGNPGTTSAYVTKAATISNRGIPYIAIPTTAGTGSEVTPWATVWDVLHFRKYSLDNPLMFPDVALVDPVLTHSMPASIAALTGIDALTQAIEAYWSKHSQPISDMYALEAIRKIFHNLEDSCMTGTTQARGIVAAGSLEAGLAFSNTRTTICHSLSYPMTVRFGIPHGQATSITLGAFLEWNADTIRPKLGAMLDAMGADSPEHARERIRLLMEHIGLATTFGALGLDSSALETVLEEGFYSDRSDNNPTSISADDARFILFSLM